MSAKDCKCLFEKKKVLKLILLTQSDEVNTFMERLELWKRNTERNSFDMFHTFERCRSSNEKEANKNFS